MLFEVNFHFLSFLLRGCCSHIFVRRCVRQTALTCLAILTFFLQKESNKEKLFSFQILPLFEARCSYGAICDYLQYFRSWLTLRRLRRLAPQRTRFARLRRGGSLRLTSLLGNFLPSLTSLRS